MDLSTTAHYQQLHHPFSYQPLEFPTQSSNPTPTNHSFNSSPDFSSSTIQESESLENMIMTTKSTANSSQNQLAEQKKLRPPETEPQQCLRCESTNTKFCYYNNYSLTQPMYFCKACPHYWTKGGTLRNVPVRGGCRKSAKRAASNSPSQFLKRPHTADDHAPNPVFSDVHGYPAGMLTPNFTDFDAGVNNFFGQHAFFRATGQHAFTDFPLAVGADVPEAIREFSRTLLNMRPNISLFVCRTVVNNEHRGFVKPVLVQKLADRNNISLGCGFVKKIWFGERYEGEKARVLERKKGEKLKEGNKRGEYGDECGISVVTVVTITIDT